MLARKMISPADTSLYKVTNSVEEAVAEIRNFYRVYHSLRYVRGDLVLRLQRALIGSAAGANPPRIQGHPGRWNLRADAGRCRRGERGPHPAVAATAVPLRSTQPRAVAAACRFAEPRDRVTFTVPPAAAGGLGKRVRRIKKPRRLATPGSTRRTYGSRPSLR